METQTIALLSVLSPYILLGIGVLFIGLEAIIASFILIWFGIGFILTAIISLMYNYTDGIWQLATVTIISLLLIAILRKKVLEKFLESQEEISDNFLNEGGIGVIKNEKVFYKGMFWEIDSSLEDREFEEGEKVVVLKTHKNTATIEKK